MPRCIWKEGRRYYYWDKYDTNEEAKMMAIKMKKKYKGKSFILKHESGYLFPEIKYTLYLTKAMRLFG